MVANKELRGAWDCRAGQTQEYIGFGGKQGGGTADASREVCRRGLYLSRSLPVRGDDELHLEEVWRRVVEKWNVGMDEWFSKRPMVGGQQI